MGCQPGVWVCMGWKNTLQLWGVITDGWIGDFYALLWGDIFENQWINLCWCCLMTHGLSKDIWCHVWPYFSKLKPSGSILLLVLMHFLCHNSVLRDNRHNTDHMNVLLHQKHFACFCLKEFLSCLSIAYKFWGNKLFFMPLPQSSTKKDKVLHSKTT